ncbi:MAG: hypothetical protein ACI8UR_002207 [Natronomonas sp.]|jgi:hypothetical protein|uniref:hypothetical protein n=1 Tax=Natronomonas sp. TaxID=2184060 RepID=UPI003989A5B2
MEWRCAECGRSHDEPPETCVCGSSNVEPADEADTDADRYSLLSFRKRLLNPREADRSLIRDEPYVTFVFRLLFGLALVGAVVLTVQLLV